MSIALSELPKCSVIIEIPKKAKNKPDFSISEFAIDKESTLIIKGKCRCLSDDEYSKRCNIEPSSIKVVQNKDSLISSIERSRKGLKVERYKS
jgi:hypothetical protein